jgi:TatD DNase family protein
MFHPHPGDYIDIHNHDSRPCGGVFILDNLMAHEGRLPDYESGMIYSLGIHPWFLSEANQKSLLEFVRQNALDNAIAAIGETGYDKLKGPPPELQMRTFEEHISISEEIEKPLVIHCVRAWDELMASHRKLKPKQPWLIHGFRGKKELALQLISRNMYISFWFDFVIRPEAADLIRSLPADRIFLETDGSGADIREIYSKVAADLHISVEELRNQVLLNYNNIFKISGLNTE